MTSQVFCEVVGVGLEENKSSESESNDYSPNEPRVHRNTKHGGLENDIVCVSVRECGMYTISSVRHFVKERGRREREREINLPSSSQPG